MTIPPGVRRLVVFCSLLLSASLAFAQLPSTLGNALQWRGIGPHRGGRTRAAAGVPSQPNVFYVGAVNGGVWRSEDYGRTWQPIFDGVATGSVGAIGVAESDPNTIYVASGEGLLRPDLSVGDGVYKSTDRGKTWTHLGLRDGQQIPELAIDPRDPNHVLFAVFGHPYGPNPERGVFLTTDGGQTYKKVLYKDEYTGADDVKFDPSNPQIVYATLWQEQNGPWENSEWSGPGGGIYKSTDGGNTWQQLSGGLPQGIIQAHIAIANSDPRRLIATVATEGKVQIYGSNDAGATWTVVTDDKRPAGRIGGGDLSVPRFDPKNPDVIIVTSTVTWKSVDGGKTWTGFRGAPGGDDYQNSWINPNNPNIILLTSDQGAIVTVDGGNTWSSWYNQPTAQIYHVSADNNFPYRLCGGQQESGSVCILSRGDYGAITFRDWTPVDAEEYAYVQADPVDPDIVYGGSIDQVTRWNRKTKQVQRITPRPLRAPDYRVVRTEPLVFSPRDPKTMYFTSNQVWKSTNGGQSWTTISPDLTRETWQAPASVGKYKAEKSAQPKRNGVIYTLAPSPLDINRIWAGTDDGLIQLTIDGGAHWTNVTPPALGPWMKVSIIEASHFDAQTAYAAINTLRLDDLRPHIVRTHDGGKTWQEVVAGIPQNENTNVVREDPTRKGLLYAGTERAVYVSFDDGDHWQSLRLNMPGSSVRDLAIKDADLVAATHGRGFWILDDISALRQWNPQKASAPTLFNPATAIRVRWNMNTDTPLPPDEPFAPNPPDGAVIDYSLPDNVSGPVVLEIRDAAGKVVHRISSEDPVEKLDPAKIRVPMYWPRRPEGLSAAPGMHRYLWDMHYPRINNIDDEYPIAAIPFNTAPAANSPWVMPGDYTVSLTAGGKSQTAPITIKMDPRVKTPAAALQQQFALSMQMYEDAMAISKAIDEAEARVKQADADSPQGKALEAFLGADDPGRGTRPIVPDTLRMMRSSLLGMEGVLQDADVAPSAETVSTVNALHKAVPALLQKWQQTKTAAGQ